MKVECILCKNSSVDTLCEINVADLCSLYSGWLSSDISSEFNGASSINYVACPHCKLKFFFPLISGSSSFYDALSRKMELTYYQDEKREYQFAGGFIKKEDRVLDVGSGRGLFSKYVLGEYTGLDFNPSAIEQAEKSGIRVINESLDEHAGRIKVPYSVVTAFQVLEHMAEPDRFIIDCLRCLRPGGLLIFSVPSEDSYVSLLENAFLNMPPHHLSRWSDQSLVKLQNQFGLALQSLEHEKLEQIHFESFVQMMANRTVRTMLHWDNPKLIDLSFRKRIFDRVTRYVSHLLKKVYAEPMLWPIGHSVTAVYRKL
jgi:2-polyprenyl-3-methyl-5-hydroxy-6-metoxy-1,4-benzoquinol methylase